MSTATRALPTVAHLLDQAGVPYAVIGAHAVNAWVEPRITADIDVTVQAAGVAMDRLERVLSTAGGPLHESTTPRSPRGRTSCASSLPTQ